MAKELAPLDISTNPDLVRLVEEVARSGERRVLRRADEDVALLMPLPSASRRTRRTRTPEDYEAFLASAGGWADLDLEGFLVENDDQRKRSSRPRVEL